MSIWTVDFCDVVQKKTNGWFWSHLQNIFEYMWYMFTWRYLQFCDCYLLADAPKRYSYMEVWKDRKQAKTIATADCSFTKIVDLYSTTWYWLGKPVWTWQDIDLYNCQANPFHLFITVENLNIGVGRHHHGHLHICSIVIAVSTAFGGASSECQSQSGTVGATVLSGLVKLDVNGQVVVSITLFLSVFAVLLNWNSRRNQNSGSMSQFHTIAHLAKKK